MGDGAAAADAPEDFGEGTVQRLTATDEGGQRVVRFVLEMSARVLPVEMRGDELRGVLSEGDRVKADVAPMRGGTLLATRLTNLTTGAQVEMWRAPRRVRTARLIGASVAKSGLSAIITGLVGVGIGAIFVSRESGAASGPHPAPGSSSDSNSSAAIVAGILTFALVIVALYLWRRQRGRRLSVALLTGVLVGAAAAALVVAFLL